MKEYTIYYRHGSGKPYMLETYKSLENAKIKLYDVISLEIERKRPFFVDNDFYDNKYDLGSNLFYLSILERQVDEWHKYKEIEEKSKDENKILYMCNYK